MPADPQNQPPRWLPRPVRGSESAVIKKLLHLDETVPHFSALLASVDQLIVQEGCDCGCDALFFDNPRRMGTIIVGGIGQTAQYLWVEAILWARDATLTFLELEPLTTRPRRLPRLPRPESIVPYPEDFASRRW
jgi:hypothetical protein